MALGLRILRRIEGEGLRVKVFGHWGSGLRV